MTESTPTPPKPRRKKIKHFEGRFEFKAPQPWLEDATQEANLLGMTLASFVRMSVNHEIAHQREMRGKGKGK